MLQELLLETKKLANPEKAKVLARFFKTGVGQYGEGDIFYGLTVPQSRIIVKKYQTLPLPEVSLLLKSKVHEERLIALLILVAQFAKADAVQKKVMYEFYLSHTKYINNWDLVDLSAPKIVGEYLYETAKTHSPKVVLDALIPLANSADLWKKRIAMLATFAFIYQGEAAPTLRIADILLLDKHDLIQKAVGWMLREVGKRVSEKEEKDFLQKRYKTMPRTTLRYAIERFDKNLRQKYLHGLV